MERLTYRSPISGKVVSKGACLDVSCGEKCEECKIGEIIHKLFAYEETSLTPEEIMCLCEMDKRSKMAKMLRWEEAEAEGRLIILPEAKKRLIVQCDNMCISDFTAEEISNLLEAWDAGRMEILPCKIGTHLWRVTYPYREEPKVTEYVVKNFRTIGKKHKFQIEVQALNVPVTNWMYYDDFFTTYEEAQAELEKLKVNEK